MARVVKRVRITSIKLCSGMAALLMNAMKDQYWTRMVSVRDVKITVILI